MKIYYINSTHWDREWYMPFQGFRYNLVEMVDGLLDIMEKNPEYKLFCFDGQTIVLEDYAQVVPEGAERIKKLIHDGRLRVGPWYVMPDEFLVSGESLIRNLMVGHEIAKKWGAGAWKYGYVCDIFGHVAQLPQILSGFDIHGAYMSRGLGRQKFSHFVWKAPNGTKCYGTIGQYGSFTRRTLGKFHSAEFPDMLKRHITMLSGKSDAPVVVFSNTDDHAKATPHTPQLIKLIGELFPDAEIIHKDLSGLPEELAQYESILPVVCGELNEACAGVGPGGCAELLPNCLSSYYPLKQENDRCQNLLEQQIEPMVAISAIEGHSVRHSFVDLAYKYLLENQPHDSICGCSADQVHKDMIYRFDQVKHIIKRLKEQFWEFKPDGESDNYELRLYNFTAQPKRQTVTANVNFYQDYPEVWQNGVGERYNRFTLHDASDKVIPYQIISVNRNVTVRIPYLLQVAKDTDVYTIRFEADLPAFGYANYVMKPGKLKDADIPSLPHGENWAENELIRLEIGNNGQLSILDKRNGKYYQKLHEFVDDCDVGDGWTYVSPPGNYSADGAKARAVVTCTNSGFASVTFRVDKTLQIPTSLCGEDAEQTCDTEPLALCYHVTIRKDSPLVEIDLVVENTVKDHRLRMVLPTNISGDTYFAGQAFYCVSRKTGLTAGSEAWPEPEQHEKNMDGIFGKRGADGDGLAFLSAEGLHECAAFNDSENTLAVTLFRSFESVYLNGRSEQAQLQGKLTFRYAIVPIVKGMEYSDLLYLRHELAGTDFVCSRRMNTGELPESARTYFSLDNHTIQVSLFKRAQNENGYILRLFNASDDVASAKLALNFTCTNYCKTNLNEEDQLILPIVQSKVLLSFDPWEIQTVRIF